MSNFIGQIVTAIDIGTTKICVLVAHIDAKGKIDILGIGQSSSQGMKKGVVINVTQMVDSIKKAIHEAETMSGLSIELATVGIAGGHIQSFNSKGVVAISKNDVTQYDVDRVVEAAKAVAIPQDREILHVVPQFFRVDNQEYVQDSVGMYGVRLEAQVHIITGGIAAAQNIIKTCEQTGIHVKDIVLEQIASANAVLTKSERDQGIGIFDIGGGTSDFAIYKNNAIRHSKVFPIAGNHFTNDVAIGCGISAEQAEQIKKAHGFVAHDFLSERVEEPIQVTS